ncbi:hypothetical protein M3J09_006778 [Ascochyta lentis]
MLWPSGTAIFSSWFLLLFLLLFGGFQHNHSLPNPVCLRQVDSRQVNFSQPFGHTVSFRSSATVKLDLIDISIAAE